MDKVMPDREPTWCTDCIYENLYPEQYAPWEKGCQKTVIRRVRLSLLGTQLTSVAKSKRASAVGVRDTSRGERTN